MKIASIIYSLTMDNESSLARTRATHGKRERERERSSLAAFSRFDIFLYTCNVSVMNNQSSNPFEKEMSVLNLSGVLCDV